jgi:hypothetical protein
MVKFSRGDPNLDTATGLIREIVTRTKASRHGETIEGRPMEGRSEQTGRHFHYAPDVRQTVMSEELEEIQHFEELGKLLESLRGTYASLY